MHSVLLIQQMYFGAVTLYQLLQMDDNAWTVLQRLRTVVILMIGGIITSTGAFLCKFSFTDLNVVSRFADRDMLMRYHWGLGVGHVYAHESTTESVKETLQAPSRFEPDIVIPDCHIDMDEKDSDGNSSFRSPSPDLDNSDLDDFDVEIAAMYNWGFQDEEKEEYEF